jgi:hypothetical protein
MSGLTAFRSFVLVAAILSWKCLFEFSSAVQYQDFGFAAPAVGASGGCTSDGFTQFTLNGPIP